MGGHGPSRHTMPRWTMPIPHPSRRFSMDDLGACVRVLRAIEADRSHLTRLTQEQRRELLTLAGLVAKPERHDLVRMAKAFRRREREAAKEHDRKAIEQTGLRTQRRSRQYAPLWLELPKPEELDDRPRLAPGACLLRLQAALFQAAPLLRFNVRCMWRLQLCQARADGRPRRPLCAGDRRAGQDRLSGVPETAAGRRARGRHDAISGRCRDADMRRRRIFRPFASAWKFTASICAIRRASSNSRGSCSSDCRVSTTFSTTPARRCVARRASSSTCWNGKRNRSARCPRRCAVRLSSHDELRRSATAAVDAMRGGLVPGAGSAAMSNDVPREPLRRGRTAGRSARNQQLAPSHARSRNARAARGATGERHRAIHSQCAPETADAAHRASATSTS